MPKLIMSTAATILLLMQASNAMSSEKSEGQLTAERTFASIDADNKGYVHMGNMEAFSDSVFLGMDADDNLKITYDEFSAWDPGFASVAEKEGRPEAYITATKIVFAFWDRDGNGEMTRSEMRHAVNSDFRRADLDDDAVLSQAEFLNGFSMVVALRAAIRPDL